MKHDLHVSLKRFVFSLSQALDLINPVMADHHKRVAYIALRVAETAGLTGRTKEDVVVAAALHDIGALPSQHFDGERTLEFKLRSARFGYQLLQKFKPFRISARIVRFHQYDWAFGGNKEAEGETVPIGSHIVHLAKLVDSLVDRTKPFLQQAAGLAEQLDERRESVLAPEFVDAFLKASASEAFWLDLNAPDLLHLISARTPFSNVELNLDSLQDFAELLAQVIDFRSRFTATHSSGVAACAATLAQLFGFPEADCRRVQIAGYLHDLGKLAIPTELLEKKSGLTEEEWQVVRGHPYFTYRILASIKGLEDIALWCGAHHERLRGTGYPFRAGHADIPLEARILAMADIFTALAEDRPYRGGLGQDAVLDILRKMVDDFELDRRVFEVLKTYYVDVDRSRIAAQRSASQEYRDFMDGITLLDLCGARDAHLSWKLRLRAYLDGKGVLTHSQLVSPHECDLGRWYYSEGLFHYGHIPEMRELEEPHAALHRLITTLVDHKEHGRRAEAEACYAQVEPLSRQIVTLLSAIERQAAHVVRRTGQ